MARDRAATCGAEALKKNVEHSSFLSAIKTLRKLRGCSRLLLLVDASHSFLSRENRVMVSIKDRKEV